MLFDSTASPFEGLKTTTAAATTLHQTYFVGKRVALFLMFHVPDLLAQKEVAESDKNRNIILKRWGNQDELYVYFHPSGIGPFLLSSKENME